jgi:hypothetical protein
MNSVKNKFICERMEVAAEIEGKPVGVLITLVKNYNK